MGTLVCLLVPLSTTAQIPIPVRDADRSVHDVAGVLDPPDIVTMERFHTDLYQQTGVAIVVVTMPTLGGEPIRAFGVRLSTEWGVGDRETDRGIIVVLAIEERDIDIETGYGAEGFLPDGRAGAILDTAVPLLTAGEYSAGMLRISAALVAVSAEEFGVTVSGAAQLAPRVPRARDRSGGFIERIFGWMVLLAMG
ncbi:MAG: TPM domain-containing protein, partial [Acidobacteriota bacterium]|nr:TPM domain-containing protein [Acidobacteriota bacterium]